MSVRVRFAPSPTGFLHIGGARTALFNWLLARQQGGTFILRVEDTDVERSDARLVDGILEGMRWLGLDWDGELYFQSQRLEMYRATAQRLIESGAAYRDFSPPGAEPDAYRAFRDLSADDAQRRADGGESFAVRFKVPEGATVRFDDLVFGHNEVETANIADFVILRSDGHPTYHLSVVTDDLDMGITHVVRGADHLSNTNKHVLLFEALGEPLPIFAHLPLILGADKKRLSKRHGATSVMEYSTMGYLPEALRNYLALLGWSPGDDREVMTAEELTGSFSLSDINKANAVFDPQKLEWMNGTYISELAAARLEPLVRPYFEEADLWRSDWETDGAARDEFNATLELLKGRTQLLGQFAERWRPFFSDEFEYQQEAIDRFLNFKTDEIRAGVTSGVGDLAERYERLGEFDLESTEAVLREVAAEREVKAGPLIGAVRVATTGSAAAPGIFDVLVTLGRQRTVERLRRLLPHLK